MAHRLPSFDKPICIIGAGGFARETLCCLQDAIAGTGRNVAEIARFVEEDASYAATSLLGVPVIRFSEFDPARYQAVVAIGEPSVRRRIVELLPADTSFATIIHPTVVMSEWVEIGAGSIITAGTVLTCDIRIGRHAHLNLYTTVGHDCRIGDYFTSAPGVNISGECVFGDEVYIGTNAALKQGIRLASGITIGMGAVVTKSLAEAGVYIGNPAQPLRRG